MLRLLPTLLLTAISALSADLTGNWNATAEGPNGAMSRTFTLKQEGAKLTGKSVSSMVGESVLEDGKVDGDNLSFVLNVKFQDNEMKLTYKGKIVSKDEIKFTVEVPQGGGAIEWVAKRAS